MFPALLPQDTAPVPHARKSPRPLLHQGLCQCLSLLPNSRFSVTFLCAPVTARSEKVSRPSLSPSFPATTYEPAETTIAPIIQIWKLRFKEIKPRIPSSHFSICCSPCLEHSSPVTIPVSPSLRVSAQMSALREAFPEHLDPLFPFLVFTTVRGSTHFLLCIFCRSPPVRVP